MSPPLGALKKAVAPGPRGLRHRALRCRPTTGARRSCPRAYATRLHFTVSPRFGGSKPIETGSVIFAAIGGTRFGLSAMVISRSASNVPLASLRAASALL